MCILPPLSHKLLPSSYASSSTEESSPLAAAFPKTHDWIRDAKGREWRDVAVIPFIDENLVEKTLSEKKAELNEEEKKRNGFGTPTLFAYDANEKGEKVPNPFLGEETTINRCKVSNFVSPPYQNRAAMIKDIEAIVQAESAKQQQQQQQQTSNTKAKVEEEEDDDFEETSSARKKRGNKRAAQAKKAPAPAAPAPAPVVPASTTSEVPPAASGKSENFLPAPHPSWKELEGVNNFPYVKSLKFSSKLEKIGVKVVGGGASRHQTMVVQPESFNGDALQLANKWIDQNLFAEWPYLVEAQVLEVHTPTLRYYRNQKGKLMQEPMISQQFTAKETEVRSSSSDYNGVRLSAPSNCLVLLRLFSGMSVRNGSRTRRYAEEKLYPAEVSPLDSFMVNKIAQQHDRIKRYAVFTSIPNEKILPVGSKVFYIGAQSGAHGAYGTVTASSSKGFDLELEVSTLVGNFGTQVVGTVGKEKWSSNQEASQALGISPLTLSRITGSITFRGSENGVATELDLGLGIKYARKDSLVLGYARRSYIKGRNPNDNPRAIWEYSEKTMNILRDWKEKFPEFFTNVNKDPSLDAFDPAVIFPEKSAERVKEMSQWLSENPASSQPLVPCDSSALSKDSVKMVEAKAVEHVDNISKARNPYKKIVLKNVESSEILNPHYADESWTAGHGKKFELGDRVVYIRDTGAVPVNYQGTVVGINRSSCEVVFDREFLAGTKLQGRVDGLRGASVDVSCLLNLTHADMVFVTKEQKVEKKTTKTVSKNLWDVSGDE